MRQRRPNSWQLRVYVGLDPGHRKSRYATRTVSGGVRAARRALETFVEEVERDRVHAGNVAELLDRWLEQASPSWSPSTRRETTSLVEHHLKVQLGSIALAELTAAEIDAFYTPLLREGGRDGQPPAAGTVHRVHVVLHRALARLIAGAGSGSTPPARLAPSRPRSCRRARTSLPCCSPRQRG